MFITLTTFQRNIYFSYWPVPLWSFPVQVQEAKAWHRSCCKSTCRPEHQRCTSRSGTVSRRYILRHDQSRRRFVRGVDARRLSGVGTRSAHNWNACRRAGGGDMELLSASVPNMFAPRSYCRLPTARMQRRSTCRMCEAKRLGIERWVQVALRKAL